ncbi:MAG TPA: glycosyltransferase family 39 protein, partial [Conexibacter sp.]|nr:glycosyltransferase family 39 protein [Conexibacter sp.]
GPSATVRRVPTTVRESAAPPRTGSAATPWLALGAIVVLAAALRFATLRTQSIWFDEAATWDLVRRPFGEMLSRIPDGESNPPLFYVLEWVWTRVLGDGEFGLRSLSALAGVLTVPVAYALARRAASSARAGLAAAALVAVNPLLVWFSQEARSYALATLLSAVALLFFQRALERKRSDRLLAGWALAAALALASHYFTAFVLAPQAAWLLWRHPRRREAVAAVGAVTLAGFALLPLLIAQSGNPYDIAGTSLALRLAQVPKQFLLGYRGPLALPFGLLGAALVLGAAWLLVRRTRRPARERALLLVAIGGVGVALPLLAALAGADYLNTRNLLPALIPLLAALAVGCAASDAVRLGGALLAALCALSLAIVVVVARDAQYQRQDWEGVAEALGDSDAQRAIVITPANGELALRYYRRNLRLLRPEGARVREVDVLTVSGSPDPGKAPALAPLTGTALGVPGFGPALEARSDTYALLRFPALGADPVAVVPDPLGALRYGERFPSVAVLPGAR